MEITVSDFGDIAKRVTLVGRLDVFGAQKIEAPLEALATSNTNIVIDLEGVDFLASNSIRVLLITAKVLSRGSRKLVLLYPNPIVALALIHSGLTRLLPIVHSEDEARAALSSSQVV
jgi:anti-anti-sigma factor